MEKTYRIQSSTKFKTKSYIFGPCNEVITNVSIINQLLIPKCQSITQYPDYKKYETIVQSLSLVVNPRNLQLKYFGNFERNISLLIGLNYSFYDILLIIY